MVTETVLKTLTFAHSPDPDDAYMFYGFAQGAVSIPGYRVEHHLQDIQSLNERALGGEFEITAVSAHAYAYLTDRYWVLRCGASVGRGYGPILVTRQKNESRISKIEKESPYKNTFPISDIRSSVSRIAIPGRWTTAALVLDLWLAEQNIQAEKILMPFDEIIAAVEQGKVDSGVIIHEGQLTYHKHGLQKIWDAGEWWGEKTGLPLPLGLDVVRSDLGLPLAWQISEALRQSILYANAHPKEAMTYALQYGRGLDNDLGKRFVGMYVNEDTLTQGEEVQKGLQTLYDRAFAQGLIPKKPVVQFV